MISPMASEHTLALCEEYSAYLSKLKALYKKMDEKYENAASHYGFICRGCEDNCCRTRFYHYTHLEYLYIMDGFHRLEVETRHNIKKQAHRVRNQMAKDDKTFGHMCPLNFEYRCILYEYRPMICRLHGIPHELRKPGSPAQYHQGCNAFHKRHREKSYLKFDRTPLYVDLASMEREFKAAMNMATKIKLTVADMLIME